MFPSHRLHAVQLSHLLAYSLAGSGQQYSSCVGQSQFYFKKGYFYETQLSQILYVIFLSQNVILLWLVKYKINSCSFVLIDVDVYCLIRTSFITLKALGGVVIAQK